MKKLEMVTKRVAAGFLCGIMMTGLVACGSAGATKESMSAATAPQVNGSAWSESYEKAEVETEMVYTSSDAMYDTIYEEGKVVTQNTSADSGNGSASLVSASTRKVIKTARLTLQTLEFDSFVDALDQKIAQAGAYLQYADVSGSDYYVGRKSASYTIRVPEANLDMFLEGMEGIATVTNKVLGEEDVTLNYVDTESRIKTLNVEQERLLALLEKAEDLDSIILLEQRLSEVRYQLESYQSKLRTYDDKITYSTVYIDVREVYRVTEKEPETVLERIQSGWNNTIYDITTGAQDFFVWMVVNLPYLLFWGLVIVAAVVFLKKKHTKRKAGKLGKQNENNETNLDSKE